MTLSEAIAYYRTLHRPNCDHYFCGCIKSKQIRQLDQKLGPDMVDAVVREIQKSGLAR